MKFRGLPLAEWIVIWREKRREHEYASWASDALQALEVLDEHFELILNQELNKRSDRRHSDLLEDKHKELQVEAAALRAEVNILRDQMGKARAYSGYEAWGCPLCTYANGIFVERCKMHQDLDAAHEHNAKQDDEVNMLRNELAELQNGYPEQSSRSSEA